MARLEKGYAVGVGLQDILPPPIQASAAPTTSDIKFPLGQVWLDTNNGLSYILAKVASGSATWNLMAPGASDVDTISGDSGGNRPPTAGNIVIAGGTNLTSAGAGSTITMNMDAAISLATSVTSPLYTSSGVDLALTAGTGFSVNISSDENVASAITMNASAGGIDITAAGGAGEDIDIVNTAGSINITAGENVESAITLTATAGAITILAAGAANEDIDITNTAGSINITAGEDHSGAIAIVADGGTSERITLNTLQGTGVASIGLLSDVGGVTIQTGLASADAINLSAAGGGVDIDGSLQVNIASSQAAATAIQLTASDAAGGITLTAGTGNVNVAGNLALTSVATQLIMNGGAVTDFIGQATLTAGTVTVANTNIAATDRIFVTRSDLNGSTALGVFDVSITASTSFTIDSRDPVDASVETNDVSIVDYFIVRQS